MNIMSGIALYMSIWIIVLMVILPIKIRIPSQDQVPPGFARSAPENPRIALRLIITSLIAAILLGVFYWVLSCDLEIFRLGDVEPFN